MTQNMPIQKITPQDIKMAKNPAEPLVCLTAYTAPIAEILDPHCALLLVGDSLGMVLYGMDSTLNVSLDMMINHGRAVTKKSKHACIVVDLPYGTYESNIDEAVTNARRVMHETGCDAVKLEGGIDMEDTISAIVHDGIPVMAHIGLQPQSVEKDGGFKVKGKTDTEIVKLLEDAKAIERAGAFSVVIEGTIEPVAKHITETLSIPTIGIGGSVACDGQILVTEDMLGLLSGHTPKFAKKYALLAKDIERATVQYAGEVKARQFPTSDYVYNGKKHKA